MSEARLEFGDHGETEEDIASSAASRCPTVDTSQPPLCDACLSGPAPPFPSEPAFGSPGVVEQAAETLRKITIQRDAYLVHMEAERVGRLELLAEVERLRAEKADLTGRLRATRAADAGACEQRGALADALELAEPALAIKASLRHGEQEQCQRVLEAVRDALRKAGRRLP
jgi:hypothetical protein